MILHLVKCELCDKQYEFNPMVHPGRRTAPKGWFVLFDADEMQAQEGWHFCSATCLSHWIETHIAIGEDAPEPELLFIRREEGEPH